MNDTLQISLAAARVNARMTQEDVAKRLKVSKQTVINWEKGKSKLSVATFEALCSLYQIPRDNIFLPS